VYSHALYNANTNDYDIAIMKLATPTAYPAIEIGLAGTGELTAAGADVMVAGWYVCIFTRDIYASSVRGSMRITVSAAKRVSIRLRACLRNVTLLSFS
jgi:hypothetical protein